MLDMRYTYVGVTCMISGGSLIRVTSARVASSLTNKLPVVSDNKGFDF